MEERHALSRVSLLPQGKKELLDRYQLIGEIASGGMASVYLARLAGVGGFSRMVAIKRLHPHLSGEPEFVDMFLDEARIAASIHHRNVVPILEIGSSERGYYLVMEYVEGVTLARMMTHATLTKRPIPRGILLRVIIDMLSGLHAAHELTDEEGNQLGVVHRDCSPQNVLIGLDGCARITDFGIARARSRLHHTREGSMKGKLAYMAPEQTQGEEFDRRADLFSVGVVLWEILAERRLFKGKTEAETLRRLLQEPVPRLSEMLIDGSTALDAVCARALARDSAARFETAAEMADAIEQAARTGDGPRVATEREVETLMKDRYGADATEQRDLVRSWLQATPTTIGPRGPQSDRGWLVDEHSAVARRHTPAPPQSGAMPSTQRSWPPPRSRAQATVVDAPAPAAESEDTHIYDPPSTTGAVDPSPHAAPPSTEPSPSLPTDRGKGRWGLLVAAILAVATAAVLIIRTTSRSSTRSSAPPEPETPAAAPAPPEPSASSVPDEADTAEPADDEPADDEDPEAEPAGEPEPDADREPDPPAPRPTPKASPAPDDDAPPPTLPDEADDLTNPYR